MQDKIFIEKVNLEVSKIMMDRRYSRPDYAFAHWAIREIFGLSENEAQNYSAIGGPKDKEIDAFWCDNKTIFVVQAKYSKTGTREIRDKDIRIFKGCLDWLANPTLIRQSGNRRAIEASEEFVEKRRVGCPVSMIYVIFGTLKDTAQQEVELFNTTSNQFEARMEYYDFGKLKEIYLKGGGMKPISCDVDIPLEANKHYLYQRSEGKVLITTVKGRLLCDWYNSFRKDLFRENLRMYIKGKKARANKKMFITLRDEPSRFWYYNNGVNAICDEIRLDGTVAKVTNFRIVNGAQTTFTLWKNRSMVTDEVEVILRVTEVGDLNLAKGITIGTNTQTPADWRDFQSNEPEQIRLKKEFENLPIPYFYDRKEGEWDELDDSSKRRLNRIDNQKASQAFYSFKYPGSAYSNPGNIFDPTPGGWYNEIFPICTAEELLLAYKLWDIVNKQKLEYQRRVRRLKRIRSELRELVFLKTGTFGIIYLMGKLIRKRYGRLTPMKIRKLVFGLSNFDEAIGQLYKKTRDRMREIFCQRGYDEGYDYRSFFIDNKEVRKLWRDFGSRKVKSITRQLPRLPRA